MAASFACPQHKVSEVDIFILPFSVLLILGSLSNDLRINRMKGMVLTVTMAECLNKVVCECHSSWVRIYAENK